MTEDVLNTLETVLRFTLNQDLENHVRTKYEIALLAVWKEQGVRCN